MARYMYEDGKSDLRLMEEEKKWKALAHCPVLRCTRPLGFRV
jgi:hypothetical protein